MLYTINWVLRKNFDEENNYDTGGGAKLVAVFHNIFDKVIIKVTPTFQNVFS